MGRATAHREGAKVAKIREGWILPNQRSFAALRVLCAFAVCFCLSASAQETVGTGSPAVGSPGGIAAAAEAPRHPIEISGYAILNGAWTQSDPNVVSIGRNNG